MSYLKTNEIDKLWGIKERRIRDLLKNNRIEGAIKKGNVWLIPESATKPIDLRENQIIQFVFNIDKNKLDEIDKLKRELDKKRPLNPNTLKSLRESDILDWTYNSNGIEGNTLTLRETKIVLEGITIGGKSVNEHLEVINHKDAILFLEELVQKDYKLTLKDIKDIHRLVLKEIDNANAGIVRNENVIISGATHTPPDYLKVPEELERLMINYASWQDLHPVIRAGLLHGDFAQIHPFIDGNGRTSRLIMNFEIMKEGFPPIIIKKEKRFEYYDALDKGALTKDYTDFINILIDLQIEILKKIFRIIKIIEKYSYV